jgi:hypothetical protein
MQSFDVVVSLPWCGASCCSRAKAEHSSNLRFALFCDMVEIGVVERLAVLVSFRVTVGVFGGLKNRW